MGAELINTAAYILNRTGQSSLEGKSPHELWYSKKPKISQIRIIGCTAYVHVSDQQRKKMDAKAENCVLVGYEGDDGYRIFVQPGHKVCRSRDVIFDDNIITSTPAFDWPVNASPEVHEDNCTPKRGDQKNDVLSDDSRADERTEETAIDSSDSNMHDMPFMQLRDRKNISQPSRYKDFVLTAEDMLSSSEPESFYDAVHSDQSAEWQKAMQNEIQSLKDNETWTLRDLPPGKKAILCKWVYKVKHNADGSVERYEARLVIKGFSQKNRVDYDQTFSPVVRNATIRTLLSAAASEKMHLMQFDVSTAFLYGEPVCPVMLPKPWQSA